MRIKLKKYLNSLESNILYKLKKEDTSIINEKIKREVDYLQAKIECANLLRILDY